MAYFSDVRDLRNLLSVARKRRHLAADSVLQDDRSLYLTAAAALEARAERLAGRAPNTPQALARQAALHRPVDLTV